MFSFSRICTVIWNCSLEISFRAAVAELKIFAKLLEFYFFAKNSVILPNFMGRKFYRKTQFPHSFGQFWKLCLSAKFPHHRIKWYGGIFSQWNLQCKAIVSNFLRTCVYANIWLCIAFTSLRVRLIISNLHFTRKNCMPDDK